MMYYYKVDVEAMCDNAKANLDLPLIGFDDANASEVGFQTTDPLNAYQKEQLDQDMADQGYKFDRAE